MNCNNPHSIRELGILAECAAHNKYRAVAERIARREIGLHVPDLSLEPAYQDFRNLKAQILGCEECRENYLWYLAREAWASLDPILLKVNSPEAVGEKAAHEYRARLIFNSMRLLDEQNFGIFRDGR